MRMKSKNGGLPARVIAPLLGCSIPHARRLLRKTKLSLERELTLSDIGNLIYEHRKSVEQRTLERYLSRWTGPS